MSLLSSLDQGPGFNRRLLSLMLPIALQGAINSMLSMADTLMVGGLPHAEVALAGVNQASAIFFVMLLFVYGIQSGTAMLISQYWGKRDTGQISRVIGVGWMLAGSLTAVAAIVIVIAPEAVLSLTTSNREVIEVGARYARITAPSYVLNAVGLVYLCGLRCMGKPMLGTVILSLSMGINTVLNYGLIYGHWGLPALGVEGAAWATLISRAIELVVVLLVVWKNTFFRLTWRYVLQPGRAMLRRFVKTASPVVINETMWGLGFSAYAFVLGRMHNAASVVAAYTVATAVSRLMSSLSMGTGNAAGIMLGNALGRGDDKPSVLRLGQCLLLWAFFLNGGVALLFAVAVPTLVVPVFLPLFRDLSSEAHSLTQTMLYILVALIPIRAINYALIVGLLRNGGDARAAMMIDLSCMYLVGIPLAIVFAFVLQWGVLWTFAAICFEEVAKLVLALWRYRKQRWLNVLTT